MSKYPVEICDPQDQHNHYDSVQNRFDLSLHWDKPVHKPQQKPCCNKRDQDSGKWHIVFSDRLLRFGPHSLSGQDWKRVVEVFFLWPVSLVKLEMHQEHLRSATGEQ